MSEKDPQIEQFMLNEDFDSGGVTPETTPVPEALIKRTIQLGGESITVEGKTQDEIIEKIIALKSGAVEEEPLVPGPDLAQPVQYANIDPLTPEERQLMGVAWGENPDGHVQRIIEASFGVPIDELKQDLEAARQIRDYVWGDRVGADFVNRHTKFDPTTGEVIGGDYYPTDANAKKIRKFVADKGLPVTPANYDHALNQLTLRNALEPVPVKGTGSTGSTSTALSGSLSYDAPDDTSGMSDSEMTRKLEEMSAEDLGQLLRASRAASRR